MPETPNSVTFSIKKSSLIFLIGAKRIHISLRDSLVRIFLTILASQLFFFKEITYAKNSPSKALKKEIVSPSRTLKTRAM